MMTSESFDRHVRRADQHSVEPKPWGQLEWAVSAQIGNSETMTIGTCFIHTGQQNGRHYHPNCDEVLRVVKGRIIHSWNEFEREMGEGDVVSIPQGVLHNARNIGDDTAILAIAFSSAHREAVDAD